jgi:hypothetical protein
MAPTLVASPNGNGNGGVGVNGTPAGHDEVLWLAPSPLWEDGSLGAGEPAIEQPRLVELTSDQFVDELLAFLSGDDPGGEGPAGLGDHGPADGSGISDDPLVLYQPMHQRFYFVVGSLVCRRIGLPDRGVTARGETVSFVVRRLATRTGPDGAEVTVEQAWFPKSSMWIDVGDPTELVPGEEQHPMQAAPVDAPVATGAAAHLLGLDEPGRRQLHFGYVPVAGRTNKPAALSDAAASAALQASDSGAGPGDDPRLMAFRLRVQLAWDDLAGRKDTVEKLPGDTPAAFDRDDVRYALFEPSLFVLLELLGWLDTYLPSVGRALIDGATLAPGSKREQLRAALDIQIVADDADQRLGQALAELADEEKDYLRLLVGDESVGRPPKTYDVTAPLDAYAEYEPALKDHLKSLAGLSKANGGLVHQALVEEDADAEGTGALAQVPPELSGMIVARPLDAAQLDDRLVLRLVYEHEPCRPVLSKPSVVLRFAGVHDPDAPARKVRIQIPDPVNMRRFNRGIAIEMPPNLRKILDGVTPKLLKEEPLGPGGDWGIGMICSFSFQIFMVLGFIIAFIFLILLNIAFWWLAFIKICFPIPVRKSQGGG